MIKKTFLAVAVGAALTGAAGASAATLTTPEQTFTDLSVELVEQFAVPTVTVTLGQEYQIDDEIEFEFSLPITGTYPDSITVTPAGGQDFNMTLGLLQTDVDSVTYRVTELTSDDTGGISTNLATFDLTGDTVITVPGSPSDNNVGFNATVTMTASTANLSGDVVTLETVTSSPFYTIGTATQSWFLGDTTGCTDTPPAATCGQPDAVFSKTIDSEAGVDGGYIDDDSDGSLGNNSVVASRSLFTDGSATDSASVMLSTNNSGTASRVAITTRVTATLNGDFTFMTDASAMSATLQGAAPDSVAMTDTTMTYVWNSADSETDLTLGSMVFSFNNASNAAGTAMDEGDFSVDVQVDYAPLKAAYDGLQGEADVGHEANAGEGWSDSDALGAWDMDESTVTVYAVPYSPSANLFIWVTSTTANDAPYTVTATDPAGMSAVVASGVLDPNSITPLSSAILAGLEASSLDYGRVTLSIATSANMCDINVYAGYEQTVDNDRLNLETSQTIQGVHNGGNSGIVNDQCDLGYSVAP